MKARIFFCILFAISTHTFFSCSSTNSTGSKAQHVSSPPTTIPEYFNRLPGVRVSGNRVILANGEPLVVVDNVLRSYQYVVDYIDVSEIKSSRVSRNATDSAPYGVNLVGVILIETK